MVTALEMQEAAGTILKGAQGQPGAALTERELLHHVVDFANGAMPSGPLLRAPDVPILVPLRVPVGAVVDKDTGLPASLPAAVGATRELTPADVAPTEGLARLRAQLREDLAAAIGKGLTQQTATRLREAALRMLDTTIAYEWEYTRARPRKRFLRSRRYYVPLSLEAVLGRCVLLLRDETLNLGEDLKQCALPHCRAFFFSSETAKRLGEKTGKPRGRPRALYCGDLHMKEAHEATGAERTRRWRERSAAKHK